jgi:hypothetical protein
MARKSITAIKNAPVKLGKRAQKNIDKLTGLPIPKGTEDQYKRFLETVKTTEEQTVRVDELAKIVDKDGSKHPRWGEYIEALNMLSRRQLAEFGAYDAWAYFCKHKDDKIGVPEEEIRTLIIESLSDKIEGGLDFSVNYGILGSKVAQAIRKDTTDESSGEIPFCADCA